MATKATKKKPDALPLGEQLILATWFARQLGFNAPADMLEKTKDGGDTGEDWQYIGTAGRDIQPPCRLVVVIGGI